MLGLNPCLAQQAKIRTAWETGHVADEDIPASARKPEKDGSGEGNEGTGTEKEKKKPPPKKRAKKNQVGDSPHAATATSSLVGP